MDLFNKIDSLTTGIAGSQLRSDTIYNNIANVDTPNFKRSAVEFESYFRDALDSDGFTEKMTRDKHMQFGLDGGSPINVVQDDSTTMRLDGNNVDIDKEMTDLTKSIIYYQALTNQATSEFKLLNTAITGR